VTRLGELSWLGIKGFEGLADGGDLAIDLNVGRCSPPSLCRERHAKGLVDGKG